MKQITHAYCLWVINNAMSSNLWSCQDLFREAIKVKNESMHNFHHPIPHVPTPPTITDFQVGAIWIFINADLFPFVHLLFLYPKLLSPDKRDFFFFKGQLWHYESHLPETYTYCDIVPSCIKINFLSLSPSGNVSLGKARIPKEKEVENEVIPSRKALNNQAENKQE